MRWADLPLPAPSHDPERARELARKILDSKEFADPKRSILARIGDWFSDLFNRIVGSLWGHSVGIAWIVIALLLAGAAWLVLRYVRSATPDVTHMPGSSTARAQPRTARDWLDEAAVHEANGAWRLAIRARYRALIARLGERGVVTERPGRTAGEYNADVAAHAPQASGAFRAATSTFERAWYGHEQPTEHDVAEFREHAERVTASASA